MLICILLDIQDGLQNFHFANNITYKSFYYDQNQRHKIKKRLCSKPHYRAEPYANSNVTNFELGMQHLSKEFNDCYQYNIAKKENNWGKLRQNYIKCKVIKSITCGEDTKELHFKTKDINTSCKLAWDDSNSKFKISIKNSNYASTNMNGVSVSSLIGYLRCTIKDPFGIRFHIDEPFKLIRNVTRNNEYEYLIKDQMESSASTVVVLLIVCLVCIVVAVLLYHTKISRKRKAKSEVVIWKKS